MSDTETNTPNHNTVPVEGLLEPADNKNGQLLSLKRFGKPSSRDPFIPRELVRRFKLQRGSYITGQAGANGNHRNAKVRYIDTIDGLKVTERKDFYKFSDLLSIGPDEQLKLETKGGPMSTRMIDLFCPIGKGQRGLIVAPPRTGKTTLLQDIAKGVIANHPECKLIVLLVDERPEEVTDFRQSVPEAELYASSNDEELDNHIRIAEIAIERAKRLVEINQDVVLLIDSITRLSRAYNSAKAGSGRTMSGGLDARALEKPRQIFSAARNTEEAGSLTIIASALIETGSRMDELIFQEFKGTGNMEMMLNRRVAEMRLWPAIDINASGTRKEEMLLDDATLEGVRFYRKAISGLKPDDAAESTITRMSKTKTNAEFLKLLKP